MNDRGAPAAALDWGLLVLRVVTGVVFFMHGWDKLTGDAGVDGTGQFFGQLGIPAADLAAYVVVALEIVGGIALVLGLFTRPVGLLFAVEMLVALFQVHRPNGFFVQNGGYELVLLLGGAGLALALTGAGALAVDALLGDRFGAYLGASRRPQTA